LLQQAKRLIVLKHQIHVLHRRTGSAFDQIVDARKHNHAISDHPNRKIAEIRKRHILGCRVTIDHAHKALATVIVAKQVDKPSLVAGLPQSVGGVTVNRFCASGLTAVQMAADRIRVGEADVVIAGGAESMSLVPMGGNKPSFNPAVFAKDENVGIAYGMGLTAEKVAAQWKVSREAQDAFALASHQKAWKAIAAGEFGDEMTPVEIVERLPDLATGDVTVKTRTVAVDEGPRADTTAEALGKLRPVFAAKGSVTAGNSSQTSDGAGALILASESAVKRFDLQPLARFVSFAVRGVPPEIMGIGPIEAIPVALRHAGLTLDDLGWIELNEAFAAQALAVMQTVGLDPGKVNPMGGAIALGHPLGATGAIRSATVVHALRRHQLKYGMVTMCVGMGQGAAGIFERV
jgi:acetyl-CoA acyltransferase